jgi:hypothetical protein
MSRIIPPIPTCLECTNDSCHGAIRYSSLTISRKAFDWFFILENDLDNRVLLPIKTSHLLPITLEIAPAFSYEMYPRARLAAAMSLEFQTTPVSFLELTLNGTDRPWRAGSAHLSWLSTVRTNWPKCSDSYYSLTNLKDTKTAQEAEMEKPNEE